MPVSLLLPETDETTLCVKIDGAARPVDSNFFRNAFRERMDKNGHCNICVIYGDDFQGWSEDAADNSLKNLLSIAPFVRKAALVNAPDSRHLMVKLLKPLSNGEVRHYEAGEEQEALAWLKEPIVRSSMSAMS